MVTPSLESESAVSSDGVLSALGHEYRRDIFRLLSSADGETMAITALIDRVAARTQSGELTDEETRQRVRAAVYQTHLPKLQARGLVTYDSETGQVQKASSAPLQELITVLEQYESAGE